jgi:hypothetical protein
MIAQLPDHLKQKVRNKVEERKKEWKAETEGTIKNIIEVFTK